MISVSQADYAEMEALVSRFNAILQQIKPVNATESKTDAKLKKELLKRQCAVEQSKILGASFLNYLQF